MPWAYELVLTQRLFLFLSLKIITTFPATVTWKTKTCFVRLIIRGGVHFWQERYSFHNTFYWKMVPLANKNQYNQFRNFACFLTTANYRFHNMNYFTQIDVLHLWEFNTQYRREKLIMIFSYIIKVLERMTVTGFEVE